MRAFISIIMMSICLCSNNQQIIGDRFNDGATRLLAYSQSAQEYCKRHKYNTSVFFFVDMSIHSGRKRFFVVDMKADSIVTSGLVAHGVCGVFFAATANFSNEPGFYCSSLGKYKIGNKYNGRFGMSYKLSGLDSTNSNALKRNVVLHSYYQVPDNEIFPAHVCNSQGCPMVSVNFLKTLSYIIDMSKKPILLWIVN